jgi:hypothetical protein
MAYFENHFREPMKLFSILRIILFVQTLNLKSIIFLKVFIALSNYLCENSLILTKILTILLEILIKFEE